MQLVLHVGDADLEVDVEAAETALVSDLVDALAGGPVAPGTRLIVEGRTLDSDCPLRAAALGQGSTVRLAVGDPPAPPSGGSPAAELRVTGGLCAGTRVGLPVGTHVIGRAPTSEVAIDAPTVSGRHARLTIRPDGSAAIEDLGSTNGTTVDGAPVTGARPIGPAEQVDLGAVQLSVGPSSTAEPAATWPGGTPGRVTLNRPPRSSSRPPAEPIVVPPIQAAPPPGVRFGWAALLTPLALGGVMAYFFSPLMAAFALFSPVMLAANWLEDRQRLLRHRRAAARQLADDLVSFRDALDRAAVVELRRLRAQAPDPAECIRRAVLTDIRLWERRPSHADAFTVRIGTGTICWHPSVADGPGPAAEASELLRRVSTLERAPVTTRLGSGCVVGLIGDREAAVATARSLVLQLAIHHGPSDLRVALLMSAARRPQWDWTKWLPHRISVDRIPAHVGERTGGESAVTVCVVDRSHEWGDEQPGMDPLLSRPNVAAVVLADSVSRLPAACTTVVDLDADGTAVVTRPADGVVVPSVLAAGVTDEQARRCGRALSRVEDPDLHGSDALPGQVALLDLDAVRLDAAAVAERWTTPRCVGSTLRARVGVTRVGPLDIDLVADGPHALVAGTTGAGKSEFLRTLVGGLALAYPPDEVTFVLVDYKGGSAFAEAATLPHTVGLVTDLDVPLGERALRCLEAELKYRERCLGASGVCDIAEYRGEPAMPRLVVMVDEFATMATELPEFIDALVGIAQRGRSLGMHLVLATQRPSGVVSEHIKANANLRVAFRVQDGPSSVDVIDIPDAAGLDRKRPGQGLLRLGHGEVVPFQAALVSGPPAATEPVKVHVRPFLDGVDDPGCDDVPCDQSQLSEIARVVDGAARLRAKPPPRRLWLEPLPVDLPLSGLPAGAIGVADDPDHQRQFPFCWDPVAGNLLVCGMPGSGRTSALVAIAAGLARAAGPDRLHLYGLDLSDGGLRLVGRLPHAGGVVLAHERERQERLVRTLWSELERRRGVLAGGGRASWAQIVLLLDGYGSFHSAYDDLMGIPVRDLLLRVMSDGPAVGIGTVVAADRPGAVPAAVAAVLPERLVLRLADPYDYTAFGLSRNEGPLIPGRCVDARTRLEVQLARADPLDVDANSCRAPGDALRIETLPDVVTVADVSIAGPRVNTTELCLTIGIGDRALQPVGLCLADGDHALVAGPARAGKSNVLSTMATVTAATRPDVRLTAVALRRSPLRETLGDALVDVDGAAEGLRSVGRAPGRHLVLIDDADLIVEGPVELSIRELLALRRPDVHVVAAGRADLLRTTYGHWTKEIRRCRLGVLLRPQADLDSELLHTPLPRRGPPRWIAGRGYLVVDGDAEVVQTATAGASSGATGS